MYFYDGIAGITLLFAVYLKNFEDQEAAQIYALLRRKLFRYSDRLAGLEEPGQHYRTGALNGEGSLVYTYFLLYKITEEKKYLFYAKRHFHAVLKFAGEDREYDFLSGNAGFMFVAALLYETTAEEEYLEAAVRLEKLLWQEAVATDAGYGWKCTGVDAPLAGMAHGNAGFLTAYAKLYKITQDPEYMEKIARLLDYEDSLYLPEEKNWLDLRNGRKHTMNAWCHGAPGILLSRLALAEGIQNRTVEWDIELASGALFCQPPGEHLCLCHGIAGNLLIMSLYLHRDSSPDYIHRYEELLENLLCKIEEYGRAIPYEYLNPALMNGISGVALALLLIYQGTAK